MNIPYNSIKNSTIAQYISTFNDVCVLSSFTFSLHSFHYTKGFFPLSLDPCKCQEGDIVFKAIPEEVQLCLSEGFIGGVWYKSQKLEYRVDFIFYQISLARKS